MTRGAFIIGGTGQSGHVVARKFLTDGEEVILSCRGRQTPPCDLLVLEAGIVTLGRKQPDDYPHHNLD